MQLDLNSTDGDNFSSASRLTSTNEVTRYTEGETSPRAHTRPINDTKWPD